MSKLAQILFLLSLASYLCAPVFHPEVFHHLLVGDWIRINFQVPWIDHWTIVLGGRFWQSPSWLFDVLLSLVYAKTSWLGVVLFKLLSTLFFVGALACLLSSRSGNRFFGLFLTSIVAAGSLVEGSLSPEILGIAFLVITLEFVARGWKRERLAFFVLLALHANFHVSSIFSLLCALIIAREAGPDQKPVQDGDQNTVGKLPLGLAATGLFAHLLTPYLGTQFWFAPQSLFNNVLLQASTQQQVGTVFHFGIAFLCILWLLVAVSWHRVPQCIKPGELLLAVVPTVLAFVSTEYVIYALPMVALLAANLWRQASENNHSASDNVREGLLRLENGIQTFASGERLLGLVWILLCLCIVEIVGLVRAPFTSAVLPARELDVVLGSLKSQEIQRPMLHSSFVGAYVAWRYRKDLPGGQATAAIDFRAASVDPLIAREEHALFSLAPGWRQLMKRVNPSTVLCAADSPLCALLANHEEWQALDSGGQVSPGPKSPALSRNDYFQYKYALFQRRDK